MCTKYLTRPSATCQHKNHHTCVRCVQRDCDTNSCQKLCKSVKNGNVPNTAFAGLNTFLYQTPLKCQLGSHRLNQYIRLKMLITPATNLPKHTCHKLALTHLSDTGVKTNRVCQDVEVTRMRSVRLFPSHRHRRRQIYFSSIYRRSTQLGNMDVDEDQEQGQGQESGNLAQKSQTAWFDNGWGI